MLIAIKNKIRPILFFCDWLNVTNIHSDLAIGRSVRVTFIFSLYNLSILTHAKRFGYARIDLFPLLVQHTKIFSARFPGSTSRLYASEEAASGTYPICQDHH